MKKTRNLYIALTILNLLAIAISGYLVLMHFKPELSTVCNIGEKFDCDIVNKSKYASIFGIPVSIMGVAYYSALLTISIRGIFIDQKKIIKYILSLVAFGTLFALYLTGIETFVLYTYCLFCVIQQIIILIELGIVGHLTKLTKKS